MAGSRRYMPDEASADKLRYYTRDHIGSVMMITDDDQNQEYYNYDAWGEHYDSTSLPASENLIRYIGARVETFVDSQNEQDAIYEMGFRHYWATYGRFLQRDPLTYTKLPAPSNPKSVNPYIYAENNPVTKLDPSGLSADYYRGARMGGQSFELGTGNAPAKDIYNCCGPQGFFTLSDLTLEFAQFMHMGPEGSGQGNRTYGYWSGKEGNDLCDLDPEKAQPNKTCTDYTTSISPDLACTYLMCCKGGSCGNPFGGSNQDCPGCQTGFVPYNVGNETSPFDSGFSETGWKSTVNFNSWNWQDPFWRALYEHIGEEAFNQLVNNIIPWYEYYYFEITQEKQWRMGWWQEHCAVWSERFNEKWNIELFNANFNYYPNLWESKHNIVNIFPDLKFHHEYFLIWPSEFDRIKLAFDPQGVHSWNQWFVLYDVEIWHYWKRENALELGLVEPCKIGCVNPDILAP